MDRDFPPKGRSPTGVPFLSMEIVWDGGMTTVSPNESAMMAASADYGIGLPLKDVKSHLSGDAGYLVRRDDLEIALTFDELDRFLRHDLLDEEYFLLRDRFGMFHEIHDDFYDREDGWACQPVQPAKGLAGVRSRLGAVSEAAALDSSTPRAKGRKKPPGSA